MTDVFWIFLRLGLTAFGGPVAHIGYFREEFVARRKWLTDEAYADIVALCQFLPGPASSQTGLAIGLLRAGPGGAFAAWLGFTLPSAILMTAAALSLVQFGSALPPGMLAGLKAVVVAVVAHALLGMARSLTPQLPRQLLAAGACAIVLVVGGVIGQLVAIAAGLALGLLFYRAAASTHSGRAHIPVPLSRHTAIILIATFFVLLGALPLVALQSDLLSIQIADGFYRSGALVFGGGHVVLPLLQAETVGPGLVNAADFTAGYGLAQAVPGPLFTFAAFLGGMAGIEQGPEAASAYAALALIMIFLPGSLLVAGVLPFWTALRANRIARAGLTGVNAAVVGVLAAALYDPIAVTAINDWRDVLIAVLAYGALAFIRMPAWAVVPLGAMLGIALALVA